MKVLSILLLLLLVGCTAQEVVQERVKETTTEIVNEIKAPSCEDKAKDLIPSKVQIIRSAAGQIQIKNLIWLDGSLNQRTNYAIFEKQGDVYIQKPSWSAEWDYFQWQKDKDFFKVKFVLQPIDDRWFKVVDHEFIECKIE